MFLLVPLAVSIITGNARAESVINNQVSGDNVRVETKITTEVNGKTTTVESNKPGTIKITTTDSSASPTTTLPHVLATTSAQTNNQQKNLTISIISFFETLLTKLFQKLRIGS